MGEEPQAELPQNRAAQSSGPRIVLAISTILSSWLLMQIIHEAGHAIAAMFTGGSIRRIVLVPWELSRTDLILNPSPLIVCWAGPLVGTLLPILVWIIACIRRWRAEFWIRFCAGFCLIANGAYIGIGSWTLDGDAGDLLRSGSSTSHLISFGVITAPAGLMMWHGLGPDFGIGRNAQFINWNAATRSLLLLAAIIAVEIICWLPLEFKLYGLLILSDLWDVSFFPLPPTAQW